MLAANQINSSLLTVSVGALMLPVVYHFALNGSLTGTTMDDQAQSANILRMSHGVRVLSSLEFILLILPHRSPLYSSSVRSWLLVER